MLFCASVGTAFPPAGDRSIPFIYGTSAASLCRDHHLGVAGCQAGTSGACLRGTLLSSALLASSSSAIIQARGYQRGFATDLALHGSLPVRPSCSCGVRQPQANPKCLVREMNGEAIGRPASPPTTGPWR
jgi:hypothetical protein